MTTHYVSFAGNSVAIEYAGEERELLEYLFGDLDNRETGTVLSRLHLNLSGDSGEARLVQDGNEIYTGHNRAALARTLVEKILYTLVESDDSGLAIHAAAVASADFGVLIPGQSGAGKSTLAAWLARRGFSYLTDELVHIPVDTTRIEPFTRPVNLKRNGDNPLADEDGFDDTDEQILENRNLSIVPHRLFNPSYRRINPEINVILFPNLILSADHYVEPLSKGQAALKLVECLVNGRNIPSHGIDQVSRIVREVPAYTLNYSGFQSLPELLTGILPTPVAGPAPDRQHDAATP